MWYLISWKVFEIEIFCKIKSNMGQKLELMMPTELRNSKKPYAIVIGLDCIQGLQSARILSGHKVPVIGIASKRSSYSCRTNVCEDILIAKTKGPMLVKLLEELGPTFESKPVLFPCQDKNVLTISRNRQLLRQWYHLALPEPAVLELMMDKAAFYDYAQKEGFLIPPTFLLHNKKDAENASSQLTYPCIIKPAGRDSRWSAHTKSKAFIAHTSEEFLAQYEHIADWAEVLIVQKLVAGEDTNHYTCNCYFDRDGDPVVTFTSRKLRQWRPKTGQACLSEETRNDEVVRETVRLYQSLQYYGLGYLEMKRDEHSGDYFIIEPNIGRPTGRAAMAEAAGIPFLYTVYCDVLCLPLPENRQQKYDGVKWVHLLRDLEASLYHWRQGDLSLREWWRSMRGVKSFAILSWRDPLPFLTAIFQAIPVMFSPREKGMEDYRPN